MSKSNKNHPLLSLIKIQFKNKISLSFSANKCSFVIKIILYLLLLSGITAGLYFLFDLFAKKSIFGLFVLPIYYFNFLFIFIFLIIIFSCLNSFTDNLYLSPDNQFLITLPVSSKKLFLSKLIVYYFIELFRSLIILLPLFYSYGIVNNFRIGYYFYSFVILLIVLMIPVCIGSLLSVFVLKIKIWFANNPVKQNLIITLFLCAVFIGIIVLFSLIPEEIRLDEKWQTVILPHLKNTCLVIEKVFYPITLISMLILGYNNSKQSPYRLSGFSSYTWFLLLFLLIFIALCLYLNLLIIKKVFIKNISKSYENKKYVDNSLIKYKTKKIFKNSILVTDKKNKSVSYDELVNIIDSLYNLESDLFNDQNYSIDIYLELLNKYFKNYRFKIVNNISSPSLGVYHSKKSTHLVVINEIFDKFMNCYDVFEFSKGNKKKPLVLGMLFKDMLRDIRCAGSFSFNLVVILAPAAITYSLNRIFSGFRLTLLGNQLVFSLLLLIELISLFIYSSKASCIYSKDQKNNYILTISPINYSVSIFVKLINQFFVGLLSIGLLIFNYQLSSPLNFVNYIALFFAILFIYLFHLITCADIDLRSLDKYSFNANTSEKAGVQNEVSASLFSILFALIISLIAFFLVRVKSSYSCIYLMLIALILFIIRIVLFYLYLNNKKSIKRKKIK